MSYLLSHCLTHFLLLSEMISVEYLCLFTSGDELILSSRWWPACSLMSLEKPTESVTLWQSVLLPHTSCSVLNYWEKFKFIPHSITFCSYVVVDYIFISEKLILILFINHTLNVFVNFSNVTNIFWLHIFCLGHLTTISRKPDGKIIMNHEVPCRLHAQFRAWNPRTEARTLEYKAEMLTTQSLRLVARYVRCR